MRSAVAIFFVICIIGSAMSVKLKVSDTPAATTTAASPEELKQKQAAFQAELSKFIAETNKVKLIKWGDYDVYVNQNCPQPPTKPEGNLPQIDPIKNCMAASTDADVIAKEVAEIAADAATQAIPVKNSVKECFNEMVIASTLKLKPSTTKECYEKSFEESFQKYFDQIRAKLEQKGWKWNNDKQIFEHTGPTIALTTKRGTLGL